MADNSPGATADIENKDAQPEDARAQEQQVWLVQHLSFQVGVYACALHLWQTDVGHFFNHHMPYAQPMVSAITAFQFIAAADRFTLEASDTVS